MGWGLIFSVRAKGVGEVYCVLQCLPSADQSNRQIKVQFRKPVGLSAIAQQGPGMGDTWSKSLNIAPFRFILTEAEMLLMLVLSTHT